MMKRARQIIGRLLCVVLLGALAVPASPAGAAEPQPDVALIATFDGVLRLSPQSVMLSSGDNLGPGETRNAYLLFKNESGRPVQFALCDVSNRRQDDPLSLLMLEGIDARIRIGDELIYSGSYREALGRSSSWFAVAPGGRIPLHISWELRPESDNQHQGLSFAVDHLFEVRADNRPAVRLPKTGEASVAGEWIMMLAIIALMITASVLVSRRDRNDKSDEKRKGTN
ncbi:MAG: LPXTG cell wall anchor domain-containing protein [Actinomycetia bacterium]|nr:LPXTG cell wall anchor domain-containing protein [Actinomycetes bacterium]